MLERTGQLQKAYDLYTEYLEELKLNLLPGEIEPERLRAVSISRRIGQIAGRLDKKDDEEFHRVWALEETLRMVNQFNGLRQPDAGVVPPMDVRTVQLPSFLQRDQLGALIEEVGRMYTERGKAEWVWASFIPSVGAPYCQLLQICHASSSPSAFPSASQQSSGGLPGQAVPCSLNHEQYCHHDNQSFDEQGGP